MNIEEIRNEIDKIDDEIMPLLAKRFSLVKMIGEEKKRLDLPTTDSAREKKILDKICNLKAAPDVEETLYNLYTEIFIFSKELQD